MLEDFITYLCMPMHGQYGRSVANVYVNKGILVLNMLSMINVHM